MEYKLNTTNYRDFKVIEDNKLAGRAYFIPYSKKEKLCAVDLKHERTDSDLVEVLSGEWDFKYYNDISLIPEVFDAAGVEFDRIHVPSTWQRTGYEPPVYLNCPYEFDLPNPNVPEHMSAGIYRKTFEVTNSDDVHILSFLGVVPCVDLYVNGMYVGYSEGAHNSAGTVQEVRREVQMENYKNSKIGRETAQKYGDILEMERPQTEEFLRKHPRMTLQNRAKIFSPFSPLRGYDEQLAAEKQRTERVTKRILTEEEMSALSDRLMQVTKGMTITVRYFKEDTAHPEIPAVGNYITLTGKADRIDPVFRTLQVGETVVPFEDLVEISGESIMEIDQYLGITED